MSDMPTTQDLSDHFGEALGGLIETVSKRKVISSGKGDSRMQRIMDVVVDEPIRVIDEEERNFTGSNQVPTVFRLSEGEEADWDVIIQSTLEGGKHADDFDVPENITPKQWALGTLLNVRKPGTRQRMYQIGGWEVDSDHVELFTNDRGDQYPIMQAGCYHYFWLKVPQPGKRPRMEYAEQWARQHCRPQGVRNMISALMGWWTQGITHIRVKVMVTLYDIPDGPTVPVANAAGIQMYETWDNWSECQANQRLVRAAYRAMRAATADEYVPENNDLGEYTIEDQEEITW